MLVAPLWDFRRVVLLYGRIVLVMFLALRRVTNEKQRENASLSNNEARMSILVCPYVKQYCGYSADCFYLSWAMSRYSRGFDDGRFGRVIR